MVVIRGISNYSATLRRTGLRLGPQIGGQILIITIYDTIEQKFSIYYRLWHLSPSLTHRSVGKANSTKWVNCDNGNHQSLPCSKPENVYLNKNLKTFISN